MKGIQQTWDEGQAAVNEWQQGYEKLTSCYKEADILFETGEHFILNISLTHDSSYWREGQILEVGAGTETSSRNSEVWPFHTCALLCTTTKTDTDQHG